jgi:hypothetical protein
MTGNQSDRCNRPPAWDPYSQFLGNRESQVDNFLFICAGKRRLSVYFMELRKWIQQFSGQTDVIDS